MSLPPDCSLFCSVVGSSTTARPFVGRTLTVSDATHEKLRPKAETVETIVQFSPGQTLASGSAANLKLEGKLGTLRFNVREGGAGSGKTLRPSSLQTTCSLWP